MCRKHGSRIRIPASNKVNRYFVGDSGLSCVAAVLLAFFLTGAASAQTSVVTQHNDIARTGQNLQESTLTPSNVSTSSFGRLFSIPVDGFVYAQPLYLPNLTISGKGTHNVVFIATEHDSIYAVDADSNGGSNATPLWQITLLDAAHGAASGATTEPYTDVGTTDTIPEIGITGTPVIDTGSGTMYVVGQTVENGKAIQRLHALDIRTGAEKFGGPVTIKASTPGSGNGSSGGILNFDPKWQYNRAGLLLLHGIVYIGFGSHGDNGPWHGWVLSYDATTLAQKGVFCTTPNGIGSGVWAAGTGLAADIVDPINHPFGRLFVATGNGSYNATSPYNNTMNFGDDHIRFDLTNGALTPMDAFTPSNQQALNEGDTDVGSGGILLLPDQAAGGHTHLLVQAGKQGVIYLVDRDAMGGYNTTDNIVQELTGQTGGLWSVPAYWNNNVYLWGRNDRLKAFSFNNGKLSATPTSVSQEVSGFPGSTPSISANGATNAIVWSIQSDGYKANTPSILMAHDARNVATTLYSSSQNPARDNPGNAVKFTVPTVVNGKVYVGAQYQLSVYGLLNGRAQAAAPEFSPASKSFNGTLSATISDATPGAVIYYTTDGSTPTGASTPYTGPIAVDSTTTINAIANAAGYLPSPLSSATYTLLTQVATPTFSPAAGNYTSAQQVTISDTTANTTIYYTLDGSTPTTSSKLYSGPIAVNSTTTVNAIGVAAGLTNSPVASAAYFIQAGGTGIDFGNGFANALSTMAFNGSTVLDGSRLELTTGAANQGGSAFFNTPIDIRSFTTDFTFELTNAKADGMTFTIQNKTPSSVGQGGGGLGYGPDAPSGPTGIGKSIAVKFDLYNNAGEGADSTGLYMNGASPTTPSIDLTKTGVDLHSGHTMTVHMAYDGTNLAMTLTDTVTKATYTNSWAVNIPSTVGGNAAYIGFTGGTGGLTAKQEILTWTFVSAQTQQTTATPVLSPGAGTYTLPQSITITDTTPGASIFYTTDGSTPTTSSTKYTSPIALSAATTIKAIATAANMSSSSIASATYTVQAATPTFSPAPGSYTTAQSVSILDTTPNATIYYTLNGTPPTTSSPVYSGPITISSTTTIQAIAAASGLANSPAATGKYSIQSITQGIDFANGFTGATGSMTFNGVARLDTSKLQITNGGVSQAGSAFFNMPVSIQSFDSTFTFQLANAKADGFTFTIQGQGANSIGPGGGGLGYGPDHAGGTGGIPNSVAVKFDLYSNVGEGVDSTGLYTNGASPTLPAVDLTNTGINLHSGDTMSVHMTYDGTTLAMTITDSVTKASYSTSWPIQIPSVIGSNTAYVGFTGGTGGLTANQEILTWTFGSAGGVTAVATPVLNPLAGTYTTPQSVTITDATVGASIFYTLDGSAPTQSSSPYTGPIMIASTTTVKAIGIKTGLANSGVASATYTIQVSQGGGIDFGSGFAGGGNSLTFNGSATLNGTRLQITNGGTGQAGSAFYNAPVNVQSFTTDFALQLLNPVADGFTFTIQGNGPTALGPPGGGLGYGPDHAGGTGGIGKSVAVKFDLYSNGGEGTNSTGLYTNGASPTTPSTDLTSSGVNLHSGDLMSIHITYDGANLAMTLTDKVTNATFTKSWPVDIPALVGGNTAYAGFTGGTGGSTADQEVVTWTFSGAVGGTAVATPVLSPVAGTYTTPQSVTITDATAGASIFYTLDGSTPTQSSSPYTGPITIASTTTVKAIGIKTGLANSGAASATYTIQVSQGGGIDFGSGFAGATGSITLTGFAAFDGSRLQITNATNTAYQAGSAFYDTPVSIQSFTNNFTFQVTNPGADGFTFTIQGNGPSALGPTGGGLGYGPDHAGGAGGIGKSVAVKFDLYNNAGEGKNSTGLYTNGATPTLPAIDLTNTGIDLHSGDTMSVHMTYNGTTLAMTITDTVTNAAYSTSWPVNIPSLVGANTAFAGFTGGTGGLNANQEILTWTFATP